MHHASRFALYVSVGLLAAWGWTSPAQAAEADSIRKETVIYAVKGVDTLRLDKYDSPATTGNRPCVIFVFGGGFAAGARDAKDYLPFYEWLVHNRYTVVAIDYRLGMRNLKEQLTPGQGKLKMFKQVVSIFEGSITMAVEDLFDATNYVIAHAGDWQIDTEKIISCGSSAGAITVLQGEYERCSAGSLSTRLPQGFQYAGVISFAGAIFSTAGPLKWNVRPSPILLFHGDADKEVPYNNIRFRRVGFYGSKYIAGQLKAFHVPYYFYTVENTGHAVSNTPMWQNRAEIDSFLKKMVDDRQNLRIETSVKPLDKPEQKKKLTLKDFIRSLHL
jgi:predicted esterase